MTVESSIQGLPLFDVFADNPDDQDADDVSNHRPHSRFPKDVTLQITGSQLTRRYAP
jgi:hypothetical protein